MKSLPLLSLSGLLGTGKNQLVNNMENLTQQKALAYLRILYPIWMIVGMFSIMYVSSVIIVPGNMQATSNNLTSNEFFFRVGIVGSLLTNIITIFAALLLYKLFEPVDKHHSVLMVVLVLISVPIAMLNDLNNLAALNSAKNLAQMSFFLNLQSQGVLIASIFFGLWLFPLGYLIYKSGYFPKIIGVCVLIGGIGYTVGSFLGLLMPNLTGLLSILQLMTFGEIIFLGWLVIKGAKLPKTRT